MRIFGSLWVYQLPSMVWIPSLRLTFWLSIVGPVRFSQKSLSMFQSGSSRDASLPHGSISDLNIYEPGELCDEELLLKVIWIILRFDLKVLKWEGMVEVGEDS